MKERAAGAAPRPARRRVRTALAVGAGLLVGVVAAVAVPRLLDDDDTPGTDALSRTVTGEINSPDDLLPDDLPVPAGAGASSADEALTGFLDREVDRDFEGSFGYLSATDRAAYGSPAGWESAHASILPLILGYELGDATDEDGVATVSGTVTLEPGLDRVIGLTPGAATVSWAVVEGPDGSWGVSLETSAIQPTYPSDDGVVPAAVAWAEDRQACEEPANERGGLVGSASLAVQLCDATGAIETGEAEILDQADAQPVFTAFGDEATLAARIVRLEAPVELGIVLVPIGDAWSVIGVLP